MKKPASRGDTGLSNAAVAASVERFTSVQPLRQDLFMGRRFGLPPATAAALAELAFPAVDSWRARL